MAEVQALEEAGYIAIRGCNAFDGLKKIYEFYPDLIVVDRDLSMIEREDSCLRIRQISFAPVIVVGSKKYEVEILELGADAYLERPPSLVELVARVNSLLKRRRNNKWYKDYNKPGDGGHLIDKGGEGLSGLTRVEFRLASCLVLNKGKLLNHSQLINEVWGGKRIGRATLHFYIRRLRTKLIAGNILGIRGCGYCYQGAASPSKQTKYIGVNLAYSN